MSISIRILAAARHGTVTVSVTTDAGATISLVFGAKRRSQTSVPNLLHPVRASEKIVSLFEPESTILLPEAELR